MNDQLIAPTRNPGSTSNTRRYALYGALFGLAFPVLAIGISLAVNDLPISLAAILALHINQPLLWIIDTAPFFLGAIAAFAGARQDAVESLNERLTEQTKELAMNQRDLERRVDARTEELEQRNRQLRQAVQITRRMSRVREPSDLAKTVVQSIAEDYDGIVVDLYLIDERRTELALAASSLPAAELDLQAAATYKVGDASLIGQVAGSGDAGRSTMGAQGAEVALPLLARGVPVGVLHLRAAHEGVAVPTETEFLQLITDQLASALETARAIRAAGPALREERSDADEAAQQAWKQGTPGSSVVYEYTPSGTRLTRAAVLDSDPSSLRMPLELRGQRIGSIALKRRGGTSWSESDRDLADKTATQVALALENVRLLEETRERAQTEQLLSEFSSRLNQSVNLDTLLQIAVRELATLPEVAGASIYMRPETRAPEAAGGQSRTGE